jgi:hypothetical protein
MPLNVQVSATSLIALIALVCASTSFRGSAPLAAETEAPPRVEASISGASPRDVQADVPPVRRLTVHELAGTEPDPESFEPVGLEQWWLQYQTKTLRLARDNRNR